MNDLKVMVCTTEWPTEELPNAVPFLVRQVKLLEENSINVKVFHFHGNKNFFNYFYAWRRFSKEVNIFRPDIIHAQWGQSVIPTLPKKCPLVITYRGDDVEGIVNSKGGYGFMSIILRLIGKIVFHFGNEIIFVSKHMTKNFNNKPVHIIPSGIDFNAISKLSKIEAKKS